MAGTKISKAEKASKAIDEKPVKKERKPRAPTAYNNFVKSFYAEYKSDETNEKLGPKEMIALAASEWKKLSDDAKAEYKTPVSSDNEDAKPEEEKPKKSKKKAEKKALMLVGMKVVMKVGKLWRR